MPKVTFVSENKTVEVPVGSKLVDIIQESGANFPLGCRLGSCGTCRCLVESGMENLNPMTDEEHELFEALTSVGKTERLGCQLVINGDVSIRA